tara:strand:- start:1078 stop:1368 length:291 start_codon:yes stop_codon:yes gene_type:complete
MSSSENSNMSTSKCMTSNRPGHKSDQCTREEKDWEMYNFNIDEFMCSRCGRWNHLVDNCHASRDIHGIRLLDNGKRREKTKNNIYKTITKNQYKKN